MTLDMKEGMKEGMKEEYGTSSSEKPDRDLHLTKNSASIR
jgi:hypothetical protein